MTVPGATSLGALANYSFNNNKNISSNGFNYSYKTDLPIGYTRLTNRDNSDELIIEQFMLNRHTKSWLELPETKYLDAFWDGERWYNPGEDDEILAKEKTNFENQLKRFRD